MGYIDIAKDVARDMSKLLIECEQLSDDEVRRWVTGPIRVVGLALGIGARYFFPELGYWRAKSLSDRMFLTVRIPLSLGRKRGVDIPIGLSGLPHRAK